MTQTPNCYCARGAPGAESWGGWASWNRLPDHPAAFRIGDGEILVWGALHDPLEDPGSAFLSPDEHERAARLQMPQVRQRWIFARGFVREVLAGCCRVRPEQIHLEVDAQGKPHLCDLPRDSLDLHFSLSHSEEVAMVAVAVGREVGVDVESAARTLATPSERLLRHFFAESERRTLPTLMDPQEFFRLWTAREAVLKALGTGLSRIPPDLDLAFAIEPGFATWRALKADGRRIHFGRPPAHPRWTAASAVIEESASQEN